ncbi:MAG: efflux RND transporter periplasmic adaptor subunit [gamma proteobacterium endosymbiont of Lamellibrachia anaximandri]|nr:efflux RND transporter periplasmic adaptor subunit [gamma proteobacterium endosymbiont of Lamellibrachia anaximandri]MBL3535197.1 efflux RND transporter periplasmic adaptor subunit [gamma proteobacterium endosymbiont of Lamellibrachia anaximandri]
MNKKIFLLFLFLVIVATGGYWLWEDQEGISDETRLELYGNVDIREVRIAFDGNGHIDNIHVQEGDKVKQGQILARLKTARLQASVDAAEAGVAAQQQVLARLESGSRPEEIGKAQAEADAAKATAKAVRDTYLRLQKLLDRKLASLEEVEAAISASETAQAQVRATEATLALVLAGPRQEDIAKARADLRLREAELTLAKIRLADASLYAPADGIIRDRILEPGDMASPQTPVITLALVDPIWVRAYLPEPTLGRIAPGMQADIYTDSYPEKPYRGWIGYISPSAEFTPKNVETPELRKRLVYQVRIYACNPNGELRLGMPVTVIIPLDQAHQNNALATSPCGNE